MLQRAEEGVRPPQQIMRRGGERGGGVKCAADFHEVCGTVCRAMELTVSCKPRSAKRTVFLR